jgi:tetratricopeptide (TPR) repeat protein
LEEALPGLIRCLDRDPDDVEVLDAVIKLMMRSGASSMEIERHVEHWCRVSPNDPVPFRIHLEILQSTRRWELAIEPARHVLTLERNDHTTRMVLANMLLLLARYDEAASEFRTLLDISTFARAELLVGLARAETGRVNLEKAARLLDEALTHEPNHPGAMLWRGIVHNDAGEHKAAAAIFRRVQPRSHEERVLVLSRLAQALSRDGREAESAAVFEELTRVQDAALHLSDAQKRPNDLAFQVRAARSLLAANLPAEASRVLEDALTRLPPDRSALTILAECYDRLKKPDLAAATRQRAARLSFSDR